MAQFEHEPPSERVERMRIPEGETYQWIKKLEALGFDAGEIELMMMHLSDEYAAQKLGRYINEETEEVEKLYVVRTGKKLSEERRAALRKMVLEQLRKISTKDLERGVRVLSHEGS